MPVDTSVIIQSNSLYIIMSYNYITLIIRVPVIVHYIEPLWHLHKLESEIHKFINSYFHSTWIASNQMLYKKPEINIGNVRLRKSKICITRGIVVRGIAVRKLVTSPTN